MITTNRSRIRIERETNQTKVFWSIIDSSRNKKGTRLS